MKKLLYIFVLFITISCFGQFDEVRRGDFFLEKEMYSDAISSYSAYLEKRPNDARIQFKVAKCYLLLLDEESAEKPLFLSFKLAKRVSYEMYFYRGRYYQLTNRFKKALKDYRVLPIKAIPYLEKRIKECEYGIKAVKKPINVVVINLGTEVNSSENEVLPKITADNKQLYLSSYRKGAMGGNEYPMDIYHSVKGKEGWTRLAQLQQPINTKYNEACVGVSADGNLMFLYKGDNGGDLFVASFKEGEWQEPVPFPFNTPAKESSMAISPDGQEMMFVRRLVGRASQLYVSVLGREGEWSEPKLSNLDTPYDEETPFYHADGQTLFFSSKGNGSMGGYDVFYATREGKGWCLPQSIGYPLNTAKDELGFVLSADGKTGYYSSSRKGGIGKQDIYKLVLETKLFNTEMVLLAGKIKDDSGQPLEANLIIVDLESQKELIVIHSNKKEGKYLLPLEGGKEYGVRVEKEGYTFQSINIFLPKKKGYTERAYDVVLQSYKNTGRVVLSNVFFSSGESQLEEKSTNELEKLAELLLDNKKLTVMILGHTDNVGDERSNLKLSLQRAENVKVFLVTKGVESIRVLAKGLGSEIPIVSNKTKEGRAKNRRTEFELVLD